MAWNTERSSTTQHTCGGPVFGRKTPGCPRCDELLAGAAPVVWNIDRKVDRPHVRHICRGSGCSGDPTRSPRDDGRVLMIGICTFGDW